jgi:RNA polymerase subunit RPABC4/transcription elongation factor Spt4
MEQENQEVVEKKKKKGLDLEKITTSTIRGRVVILNPEESEFAKNLNLKKKGDYQKAK